MSKLESCHRKLTYDWHREIKLDSVLPPISRNKGDSKTEPHAGFDQKQKDLEKFCTSSTYNGSCDALGFAGFGVYVYPHGAVYEGFFKDGQFHGEGTITYPMGQQVDGTWRNGKLISYTFRFSDGLEYSVPTWKYCLLPDRRFQTEVLDGLHPAEEEYLTNEQPTREIPKGCYDTGDGFFDPRVKVVYSYEKSCKSAEGVEKVEDIAHGRNIKRVCTKTEEDFIVKQCRKGADDNMGYAPHLYEHWTTGKYDEINKIADDEERSDLSDSIKCSSNSASIQSTVYSYIHM